MIRAGRTCSQHARADCHCTLMLLLGSVTFKVTKGDKTFSILYPTQHPILPTWLCSFLLRSNSTLQYIDNTPHKHYPFPFSRASSMLPLLPPTFPTWLCSFLLRSNSTLHLCLYTSTCAWLSTC